MMHPMAALGYGLKSANFEMGLAAEGTIRQRIEKSEDSNIWNWRKSIFVNIQIVNASSFGSAASTATLRSVSEIDADGWVKIDLRINEEQKTGCACCEQNFCDMM
ncbi:hypothetical protein ABW20_dc0101956 [Dactylellina cionopaga]|nr:hypothetical protein ABW20_dc0101956 [Dactylellina cionopaga]